jgi:death-on-curing protein
VEFLTIEEVLLLHARLIQRIGGSDGVRDMGMLESALARPRTTFDDPDLYPGLWHKAAALMHSLVKNHPFVDGNKRTALTATGLFLELNGHMLVASDDEAASFVLGVATGILGPEEMLAWLKSHSQTLPSEE